VVHTTSVFRRWLMQIFQSICGFVGTSSLLAQVVGMRTYRSTLEKPRFEWIVPWREDVAWVIGSECAPTVACCFASFPATEGAFGQPSGESRGEPGGPLRQRPPSASPQRQRNSGAQAATVSRTRHLGQMEQNDSQQEVPNQRIRLSRVTRSSVVGDSAAHAR